MPNLNLGHLGLPWIIGLVCVVLGTRPSLARAKKIVFIPLPVGSHIRTHMNIADELTALGHQTWVCIPDVIKGKLVRGIKTDAHILHYGADLEDLGEIILTKSGFLKNFWAGRGQDYRTMYNIAVGVMKNAMDILSDSKFWSGITAVQPDLIVLDGTPFCKIMLAVPYKLNIPFAFFGPYLDLVGAKVPYTSACNPEVMSDFNDRMTFPERLLNTLIHISFTFYNPLCDENILQKVVPEKPHVTVSSLSTRAEIFLVETDHIMDYARPRLPNTILIGGTAANPSKSLENPFKHFMETATNGSVIVTFGSSILNIPTDISHKMTQAFEQLDIHVVWRINLTTPYKDNIMTSLWIPQNDLLGHKNAKVFVSHCGLNGQYEALYHAVPILCLPIFADQLYNSRRIVNKGFGLRADIRYISSNELADLIREIVTNVTYRENIQTASKIFRQLFKQPRKEAAFWLDHVLTFGGSYMRYAGQDMPLYQFLMVDVITFILAVLGISLFILYVVFCHFLRYLPWLKRKPKCE